ncbi:MAG: cob(I)yrinic acid a,c-diamide adenosyltransferase [Alphaproteobacteria bacterium]|nr:cob(I)yrinic acid a,c-diamide adenosyltransferase [Alphaproteobacteria bacterium]
MVKLDRIYTKGGDKGKTSLGNGKRVSKYNIRVIAFGSVDETNAVLGLARFYSYAHPQTQLNLTYIQNDLFDLGADLCVPIEKNISAKQRLRMAVTQVTRLEKEIDQINLKLSPLNSFVLPGGSELASYLHLARTLVRKSERYICALAAKESINPVILQYMNRLSDYLFVLARYHNNLGKDDILWKPGENR